MTPSQPSQSNGLKEWPTLHSPEDADATHRWARECLEMWETERAELIAERDRLRRFVEWVAGHQLVPGFYADDDHPYNEWITPEQDEMDFVQIHERAKEALS